MEFTACVNVGCRYGYVAVLWCEYDFMLIWDYVPDKYISSSKRFITTKNFGSQDNAAWIIIKSSDTSAVTMNDSELVFNSIHAPNPELEETKFKILWLMLVARRN
jgi:hypothetical protein